MEIAGKIHQILPEETGEGRNGPWRKQNFILETQEQYPKKVCITVWGDKIDLKTVHENDPVTVNINIESREFNGRWYTDVKAWRIVKEDSQDNFAPDTPPDYDLPDDPGEEKEPFNDLPF
ncbi:MAG: DUF3127 domain-containing protein [Bacteroidales bacterium]|nr:DUF3127 domain-containing protein [Bacteroidales bacterium]